MQSAPEDRPALADTVTGQAVTDLRPVHNAATDLRPVHDAATDLRPVHDAATDLTFRDLGVAAPICDVLEAAGIVTAFPIQALALPMALDGQDIIGQARTGTGKTLAFGIPLIERLGEPAERRPAAPRALVVVPTRELAIQVGDDLRLAGSRSGVNVVTVYGGRAYEPQIEALATADIVVGTPGRLLDLARQRHLDLSQARGLVLDEADKMLDLGFLPDVERILRLTPQQRQTMLFSATMPGEVVTLARRHLRQPTHVRAEQHDAPASVPTTEQHVFRVHQMDKIEVLVRALQADGRGLTIVFCRTKRAADQVASTLTTRGFAAAAVHGDLGQGQRERAMRAFRGGKVDVLVATDVAARGLDVDDVTHVVNYECPEDDLAYLHRIGRTGRAGRAGVAVPFVDWRDMQRWKLIDDSLGLGQPEPAETYSTSDHLFAELNIPPTARAVLPRAKRDRLGLEAEELEDIGETGRPGRDRPSGPAWTTSQPPRPARHRPAAPRRAAPRRAAPRRAAPRRAAPRRVTPRPTARRLAHPRPRMRGRHSASHRRAAGRLSRAASGAGAAASAPMPKVTHSRLSANLRHLGDLCQVLLGRLRPREHTKNARPA